MKTTAAGIRTDAMLKCGRTFLLVGLALESVTILRGPLELALGDLLLAVAVLCAGLSVKRPSWPFPTAFAVAGFLIVCGTCLATWGSSAPSESIAAGARLLFLVILVPWAMISLLTEPTHVARSIAWFVAGTAVCSAGALLQLVAGDVIPGGAHITNAHRFTGLTQSVSDLGGIAAAGAAVAFTVAVGSKRRLRGTILYLGGFLACLLGLVLSGSVSGMLATAAALFVVLARRALSMGRTVLVVAASVATIVWALSAVTAAGGLGPLGRFLQATGINGQSEDLDTSRLRELAAATAWQNIRENPVLGMGMAQADNYLTSTGRGTVHNIFIAAWHAGGVLLLLGVVVATLCPLALGWARAHTNLAREALVAGSMAAIVFAQTAPSYYNRYFWIPLMLLAAAGMMRLREIHGTGRDYTPALPTDTVAYRLTSEPRQE